MSLQCSSQYVPEGAGVCTTGGDGILIGSGTTGKGGEFVAHEAISSDSIGNAASVTRFLGL